VGTGGRPQDLYNCQCTLGVLKLFFFASLAEFYFFGYPFMLGKKMQASE
jgi:hypothetical protein